MGRDKLKNYPAIIQQGNKLNAYIGDKLINSFEYNILNAGSSVQAYKNALFNVRMLADEQVKAMLILHVKIDCIKYTGVII